MEIIALSAYPVLSRVLACLPLADQLNLLDALQLPYRAAVCNTMFSSGTQTTPSSLLTDDRLRLQINHALAGAMFDVTVSQHLLCFEQRQYTSSSPFSDSSFIDPMLIKLRRNFRLKVTDSDDGSVILHLTFNDVGRDTHCIHDHFSFRVTPDHRRVVRVTNDLVTAAVAFELHNRLIAAKGDDPMLRLAPFVKVSQDLVSATTVFTLASPYERCPFSDQSDRPRTLRLLMQRAIQSVVETCRELSGRERIRGFLAQSNLQLDEHSVGLEHHKCQLSTETSYRHHRRHDALVTVYGSRKSIFRSNDIVTCTTRFETTLAARLGFEIRWSDADSEFMVMSSLAVPLAKVKLCFCEGAYMSTREVILLPNCKTNFVLRDYSIGINSICWRWFHEDDNKPDPGWLKFALIYHHGQHDDDQFNRLLETLLRCLDDKATVGSPTPPFYHYYYTEACASSEYLARPSSSASPRSVRLNFNNEAKRQRNGVRCQQDKSNAGNGGSRQLSVIA